MLQIIGKELSDKYFALGLGKEVTIQEKLSDRYFWKIWASWQMRVAKVEMLGTGGNTIGAEMITKFPKQFFRSCQRIAKGAGKKVPRENCRKVSKMFLTLFDDF